MISSHEVRSSKWGNLKYKKIESDSDSEDKEEESDSDELDYAEHNHVEKDFKAKRARTELNVKNRINTSLIVN